MYTNRFAAAAAAVFVNDEKISSTKINREQGLELGPFLEG
jgi:hypothetical protein